MSKSGKVLILWGKAMASVKRRRRLFTTEKSCICNSSKKKIKDWSVLIVSPTKGETYLSLFLFLFVQISVFLYQWQNKCIPSLLTLNKVICTSDPSTTHITMQFNDFSQQWWYFFPFLVNTHFYYLKTLPNVSKMSILFSLFK